MQTSREMEAPRSRAEAGGIGSTGSVRPASLLWWRSTTGRICLVSSQELWRLSLCENYYTYGHRDEGSGADDDGGGADDDGGGADDGGYVDDGKW